MNTLKAVLISVAALSAVLTASAADARGRYHHHGGARFGVFVGAPLFPYYYPRYYYPPYSYYPPTVAVPAPAAPPVYIEQNPPAAAPSAAPDQSSGAYWYYCRDSQTYYPYVQQCASPWQQVVPQPAPQAQSGTQPPSGAPYVPPAPADSGSAPPT